MKKIIRITESDLSRIVKRVISENMEVSDLERKQLSDKMIKDMIDKYYLDDVVNPTTKVPYRPYNVGGKLDYNKAYREYMEAIDQKLTELGFPNGVNVPENISRQEFDNLKNKWTQSSSKLTENDLSRIVKRVINEREFSPNRIKYGKSMRGGMDSFKERRIPNSEFDEGDMVMILDYGHIGTVLNVMFDHDDQKFYYEVRVTPERGNPYRREVSSDEIESA